MALTIDATVGGVASNSYLTHARAMELAEQAPHMHAWLADVSINRAQMLIHATRLIDRYGEFYGSKTSSAQALMFPRVGLSHVYTGVPFSSSAIPDFVEWATMEWAYALSQDPEVGGAVGAGLDSLRTPSFSLVFSGQSRGGVKIPHTASDLLRPYARRIGFMHARVLRT